MSDMEHENPPESGPGEQPAVPGEAIEPFNVAEMDLDDIPVDAGGDVDTNGHLATGLFVGVIAVLLVVIYAFSMAA